MQNENNSAKAPPLMSWLVLLFLALTWGSSYILIKKGLVAFSAVQLATLRIGISAIAFVPFFFLQFKKVDWTKWKYLLIVGIAGSALPAFLFSTAQTKIPSSLAGLLSSLTPLFTLLIGVIIFKLRTVWTKVAGILMGLFGAIFLILFGQETELNSDAWYGLLVVIGTFFYALSSNTVQIHLKDMSSLTISSVAFIMLGPLALAYLLATDFLLVMQTHEQAWASLGYITLLSLAGTVVASILFFKLVQMTDAIFASTVSYLIPMIALGWGAVDGEAITVFHFIGMGLILFGVYISRK